MSRIEHVSDTALMVAACRAIESDRPDGLVRDPFAAALAGEKGMAIARSTPALPWMSFGVGVRSRFIDDFVLQTVSDARIAAVLNLGAGLDTRPWRLDLPRTLRWIEVDFPDMLDYKSSRLSAHQPRCTLEQVSGDLTDAGQRARIFAAAGESPALMITEGLLMYLPRDTVSALAAESAAQSGIRRWILDISAIGLMRAAHGDMFPAIDAVRAKDHLEGVEVLEAITTLRWHVAASRRYARDGAALAMARVFKMLNDGPRPERPPDNEPSGIYLLERELSSDTEK